MSETAPHSTDMPLHQPEGFDPIPEAENSKTLPPMVHENLEKLRGSGEVGEQLASVYLTAVTLQPELADTIVKPYNSADMNIPGTAGRATLPHDTDSGHPEIAINTTSWEEYAELMKSRQTTVVEIARKLDLEQDQVTPELFAAFALAHELGHVEDWRAKGFDAGRVLRPTTIQSWIPCPFQAWRQQSLPHGQRVTPRRHRITLKLTATAWRRGTFML